MRNCRCQYYAVQQHCKRTAQDRHIYGSLEQWIRLEGDLAGMLCLEQFHFTKKRFFTNIFILMASSFWKHFPNCPGFCTWIW